MKCLLIILAPILVMVFSVLLAILREEKLDDEYEKNMGIVLILG